MSNVISITFAAGRAAPRNPVPETDIFAHSVMPKTFDAMQRRTASRLIREAFADGWTPAQLGKRLAEGCGIPRRHADALGRTGISFLAHA